MIAYGVFLIAMVAAFSPGGTDTGHKGLLKLPCVECHIHLPFSGSGAALRSGVKDVCTTCHKRLHGADMLWAHPVNAVPSMPVPKDMLLDEQGRITCITCHAFHGVYRDEDGNKRFYLRRTPGRTFCFSCHKKLPGVSGKP
jgi:Doubled CXXCH motif (Paired_CXXCH_1)